jgi:hypothetical protein
MREVWEYDKRKWLDRKGNRWHLLCIVPGMVRLSFGIRSVQEICPLLFIFVMMPEPPLE